MTRTPEDIARGLEPARAPRAIIPGDRIHVLGAAGSAASASMLLSAAAGAVVSGCDAGEPTPYSGAVGAAGIPIAWHHDPDHVARDGRAVVDRIAASKALTAINPDQADLVAAAGTHGKSTTTGWLVHLLVRAGLDPTAFVGAMLPADVTGGRPSVVRLGQGRPAVVEADEYAGNFDPYRPMP